MMRLATGAFSEADAVGIIKHLRVSDEAFFIAKVNEGDKQFTAATSLKQTSAGWQPNGFVVGGPYTSGGPENFPFDGPIKTSGPPDISRLVMIPGTSSVVMTGLVDPSITRIDTRDMEGNLLDRDEPVRGKTLIALGSPSLQVFYRGQSATYLRPVSLTPPSGWDARLNQQAVATAKEFADGALASRGEEAQEHLAHELPSSGGLPVLAEVLEGYRLTSPSGEITSVSGSDQNVVTFSLEGEAGQGEAGEAHLRISLALEGDAWSVWAFEFFSF